MIKKKIWEVLCIQGYLTEEEINQVSIASYSLISI